MNTPAKPALRIKRFLAAATLALSPGIAACEGPTEGSAASEPPLAGADIGGEFELTSSKGETVRWGDFDGKYRIVYFGYAYCPDVCPTDVQRMSQGLKQFARANPDLAKNIQPIFISIDPERDTPEVIEQFTNAFSGELIGLTGTQEQIDDAVAAFGVYAARGDDLDNGQYLMNHSNITFLFGRKGEPIATLPTDEGADAVETEIAKWVR